MTLLRASPLAALALTALACHRPSAHALDNAPKAVAVTDSVMRSAVEFTQAFYDWYAQHKDRLETAVSGHPDVFSPTLLAALQADITAQAKDPGEIVGLDWDPFTASQDPCDPYAAVDATRRGDTIAVAVKANCKGAAADTLPATVAQLWRAPTGWVFVNFSYPADTSNLLDDLANLRREREAGPTSKHK